MKLKYNATGTGEYQNAPAGMHLGLICDMLEPYEADGQFGKRTVTRFVIELPAFKDEAKGWRFTVRTKPMTLKLSEQSALYAFTKDVLGRDLTEEEKSEFDPESLIGKWVDVVVQHDNVEGKVYDNLKYIGATAQANPPKWESSYIRVQDREVQERDPSPAEQAEFKKKSTLTSSQSEALKGILAKKMSPATQPEEKVALTAETSEETKAKFKTLFADRK